MLRLPRLSLTLLFATFVPAALAAEEATAVWPSLKQEVFGSAPIIEDDGVVRLEAPVRAEDAALVPISITIPGQAAAAVTKLTLIVDENPSPVVATFAFGPAAGAEEKQLATRVRFDRYTNVRAIAETADGKLHMTTKFVKASGGCSAPAGKDAEAALEGLGRMQIKTAAGKSVAGINQAQVAIKHPNFTGMQMDQLTRDYTPARYVDEMTVSSGGQLVFKMTGGISISENPHFTFNYPLGKPLEVSAKDSIGTTFSGNSQSSGS